MQMRIYRVVIEEKGPEDEDWMEGMRTLDVLASDFELARMKVITHHLDPLTERIESMELLASSDV